ncbi:hypothetical protein DYB32_010539 [Aphanomyces invadans]|uniref:HTH CENPB-type domain-containing protein n=1 Tax=Aphanomyces invadans TaxID=157072 RepID=A0A3R6VDQ2_9STRA|nr:hypothetical protein DYB32_010539 [Aphanomyces invadans]
MIALYQPGVKGHGYAALAKRFKIAVSSIRDWVAQKDKLRTMINTTEKRIHVRRRLDGGERKTKLHKLEEALVSWIDGKNKLGLRVLDQYIQAKARSLHNSEELDQSQDELAIDFAASSEWLSRFKSRNKLVSRRETSSRVLPADDRAITDHFRHRVADLIQKHGIKAENVLNMDQVPRYFETEGHSTIIKKVSKNVMLRKGGSSY